MASEFTSRVIKIIQSIPKGMVSTYGTIALLAGKPNGARQVSWILHSSSKKYNLPWYRVVNAKGKISLPEPQAYEYQKRLLQSEGILFTSDDIIEFDMYLWTNG